MPAATPEMATTNAPTRLTRPTEDIDASRSAPMVLITRDGRTLHEDSLGSARAAAFGILSAAAMLLAILTGTILRLG
jgi:hypothetical protein